MHRDGQPFLRSVVERRQKPPGEVVTAVVEHRPLGATLSGQLRPADTPVLLARSDPGEPVRLE